MKNGLEDVHCGEVIEDEASGRVRARVELEVAVVATCKMVAIGELRPACCWHFCPDTSGHEEDLCLLRETHAVTVGGVDVRRRDGGRKVDTGCCECGLLVPDISRLPSRACDSQADGCADRRER